MNAGGGRARIAVLSAALVLLAAAVPAAVVVASEDGGSAPHRPAGLAPLPMPVDPAPAEPTTVPPPVPTTTTAPAGPTLAQLAAVVAARQQPAAARPPQPPPLPTPLPEPNRSAPARPGPPPASPGAVWPGDFPDPFVLNAGTTYYAFGTQSGWTDVQTIKSVDLVHWQWVGDALPKLPSWSTFGSVWGPSVLARSPAYVMYYATREASTGRQCISRAVSVLPQGPYVDTSSGPLVCQLDRGGSIDPSPFVDRDGTAWLVWKSEGTLAGEPTRIWAQPLSADGQQLTGQPAELMHTDQSWELPIIEGPSLAQVGGVYYLFFSANRWETAAYAIGYAVCAGPAGPCREPTSGPVLASSGSMAGPGGPDLFTDLTGGWHLAFHAWTMPDVGYPAGARSLRIAPLSFSGDRVAVGGV